MISQLSRLLLSSGNNLFFIVCGCVLILGCASTSPKQGDRVLIPNKKIEKKEKENVIPVDTIEWTVVPETEIPPITTDDSRVESFSLEKVKKDRYKIALLLPLRLEKQAVTPDLSSNNKKFAAFYAGMKLAGQLGANIRVEVKTYYTNRDVGTIKAILDDMSLERPDIIIGSYESDIISETAEWAKTHRTPMISPWGSSTRVTEDNVFYLQLRPSITSYYEKITEHINNNFDRSKVYLLGRDEAADQTMFKVIRRINEKNSPLPQVTAYQEMILSQDDLMNKDSLFSEVLEDGARAFILPQYATRDESYVYSCLRKLYAEQGMSDIYIYTMPIFLNSDRIDINIFKNVNARTCEFRFPDMRSPQVEQFREQYYKNYGWLPSEDAYYGYDVMRFIIDGLQKHGQYFHYYQQGEIINLMQMKINIQPYFKVEGKERPDFLVNDHLYIIEYDTDHFNVTDIR